MNIPLDYEGIIALAKENDLILTPNRLPYERPTCCVVACMAIANGFTSYCDFKGAVEELHDDTLLKIQSIEAGFEDTEWDSYYLSEFYQIGQELRKYSKGEHV